MKKETQNQGKAHQSRLRATNLRFTQKKIILANTEFLCSVTMARIQLKVNKNIIHLDMLRVSVLPNSAVETTMKAPKHFALQTSNKVLCATDL